MHCVPLVPYSVLPYKERLMRASRSREKGVNTAEVHFLKSRSVEDCIFPEVVA